MAQEFKLPELGENVETGTIANVLVKEGDTVSKDQPVLEIETDKAVAEIPSPFSGKITSLKVAAGQKVTVGQTIFVIEESSGGGKEAAEEAPAEAEKEAAQEAPTKREAAPAPQAAQANGDKSASKRPNLQLLESATPPKARGGAVVAAPSVRRLAREMGVDLSKVPTADPNGRVTIEDIRNYADAGRRQQSGNGNGERDNSAQAAPQAPASSGSSVDEDKWGSIIREPMSGVRKKTAAFMSDCWSTIPHVTHHDKADITSLEGLRKKHGKRVDAAGGKLTVTSFIIKLLASALQRHPKFNASIDLENEEIIYRQYYHVGVAVDTDYGLLVPVIRDVDQKSVADISAELPELARKARDRKLSLEEMQGATFTLSNLGGFGGTGFTPIISAPQVAILGVSRSAMEPVYTEGVLAPRLMLPLSLSYDHRVIDGADAAKFLRWFAEALEQPWLLHLDI